MSRLIVCCSTHRSLAGATTAPQEEQKLQATFSLVNADPSFAKHVDLAVRSSSSAVSAAHSCSVFTLPLEAEAEFPSHLTMDLSSAQRVTNGEGSDEATEPRKTVKADIALAAAAQQDPAHPTNSTICVSQEVFALGTDALETLVSHATGGEEGSTLLTCVYKSNVHAGDGETRQNFSLPEGSAAGSALVTLCVSVFREAFPTSDSDGAANAVHVDVCSQLLESHLHLVESLPTHAATADMSAGKDADGLCGLASELEQAKQENAALREKIQAVEEQRVQDIGNLRHEIVELRNHAIQHQSQLDEESDRGRRIALLAAARATSDAEDCDATQELESHMLREGEEVAAAGTDAAVAAAAAEIPVNEQEKIEHPLTNIEPNSNVHEVDLGSLTDAAAVPAEDAEPTIAEEEPHAVQNHDELQGQPAALTTEHSGEVSQHVTDSPPQAPPAVVPPTTSAPMGSQRLWETAPTPAMVSRTNRRTAGRSTQPLPDEADTDSTRSPTGRTFATPRQGQIQPRTTRALSPVVKVRSSLSGVSYDNSYYKTNPDTMERLQRIHRLDNSVDRLQQNKRSQSASKWSRSESAVQTGLPAAAHNAPTADAHAPVYAIGDEPPASRGVSQIHSLANGDRASARGVRPVPGTPIESSRRVPSSLIKSTRTPQSPTSTPIKRRTLDVATRTPLRKRPTSPLLSVRPRETGKASNQFSTPAKEAPQPAPHGVQRSAPQKLYRIASPPQHVETRKVTQPAEKVAQ